VVSCDFLSDQWLDKSFPAHKVGFPDTPREAKLLIYDRRFGCRAFARGFSASHTRAAGDEYDEVRCFCEPIIDVTEVSRKDW